MQENEDKNFKGHAVLAVKADENYLTCINSWGTLWGDEGKFTVSKSLLKSFTSA